ncbi:hypothetical protein [Floccifex sp.]|uniref:hypothetical protein n=1 Tax=Floccifex sp. TaxID=2815810 RepID=UPI003F0D5A1A
MKEIINKIQNKNHKEAYEYTKQLLIQSMQNDNLYQKMEDFIPLLSHTSSYVRTRAFQLCMAQARWDTQGKKNIFQFSNKSSKTPNQL